MPCLRQGTAIGWKQIQVPFQPNDGSVAVKLFVVIGDRDTTTASSNDQAGLLAKIQERLRFQASEGCLPVSGEDLSNFPAYSLFQLCIRVFQRTGEDLSKRSPYGGLAAAGHTDEDDVLRLSAETTVNHLNTAVVNRLSGEPFCGFFGLGDQHPQAVDAGIPSFIVVIASFVTLLQMVMQAYVPDLYATLGLFIPLIVVNCIVLGRAEAFAAKNNPVASMFDGLGMGLGFTIALTLLGAVREFLGTGKIFNLTIMPEEYGMLVFVLAPGAFIALGYLIALINSLKKA